MRRLALILGSLALIAAATPSRAQAPSEVLLQVSVVGFRGRTGRAVVALYDRSDAWLDVRRALRVQRVPITGDDLLVTFDGLAPGTYAVSVVHDENANDRMDMQWLPIPHPAEGAGASRNPRPTMGPPSWDSARIELTAPRRILVALTY